MLINKVEPNIRKIMKELDNKDIINIFISQPMSGYKTSDILKQRNKAMEICLSLWDNINFINNFDANKTTSSNVPKFHYLGYDIQEMSYADIIFLNRNFYENFYNEHKLSKGCAIELNMAYLFEIPVVMEIYPINTEIDIIENKTIEFISKDRLKNILDDILKFHLIE